MEIHQYTQWDRPPKVMEPGGGPSRTEQSGYVSVKTQVQRMQLAGMRLRGFRFAAFDAKNERDVGPQSPLITSYGGLDPVDVERAIQEGMKAGKRLADKVRKRNEERKAAIAKMQAEAEAFRMAQRSNPAEKTPPEAA